MPARRRLRIDGIPIHVIRRKGKRYLFLRYTNPDTGKVCERSSGYAKRADANKAALRLADRLAARQVDEETGWTQFRQRYQAEKMAQHPVSTRKQWLSTVAKYEDVKPPLQTVQQAADPNRLSRWVAKLRADGLAVETIKTHVARLQAALAWAVSMRILDRLDRVKVASPKGRRFMRGRPIDVAEFRRMLRQARTIRPGDWRAWVRLLRGLWLSGLRISEAVSLSWDQRSELSIDLTGKHPALRIRAEAQKSNRDEILPMTPDFARWLLRTPKRSRTGPVFPIHGAAGQMSLKRLERYISAMGRSAGISVGDPPHEYASAHDLRRSFGTRWSKRVMPAVLQKLMRHASIETTMRYYVEQDVAALADDLWRDAEK